jgi:hypothetical protein
MSGPMEDHKSYVFSLLGLALFFLTTLSYVFTIKWLPTIISWVLVLGVFVLFTFAALIAVLALGRSALCLKQTKSIKAWIALIVSLLTIAGHSVILYSFFN